MRRLLLAFPWIALAGCGGGDQWPDQVEVAPARGTVTVNGAPLGGAIVMFHPTNPAQKMKSQAVTGPDGAFAATTYKTGDGAPPGEYVLTVVPNPDPGVPDARYGPDQTDAHSAAKAAKSSIPAKYQDAKTSPLKATVDKAKPDLGAIDLK